MSELKIIRGMNAGHKFVLSQSECVIGRDTTCDVVLKSRTVSRQHARVVLESDGYYLEDMRSVNGTALNGCRVNRRTLLTNGDRITIFDSVLVYEDHASGLTPDVERVDAVDSEGSSGSSRRSAQAIVTEINVHATDHRLDSNAEAKLRAILKISRSLGSSLHVEALLPKILDVLFEIFPQAQKGFILQAEKPGVELVPTAIKHRGDSSDTISPIGGAIVERVIVEGTAFLSGDVLTDERLEELSNSVLEETVRSIMCAPLMGPSKTAMGAIHLESTDPKQPFTPDDLEVLVGVACQAGQALEYARLHRSLVELDWRHRELALAKDVQLRFLPDEPPRIDGYAFYHHYTAADSVAGDYFDYVLMPDGRMAITQGDVSGKGITAALVMARLCSDVRYCLLAAATPAEAIDQLNRVVSRQVTDRAFVTFLVMMLDPTRHELTIINAGHPPPLLRRGASVDQIGAESSGAPLGVLPDTRYEPCTVPLSPGDVVLACTDGIYEALNSEDKLYGLDSVLRVTQRTNPHPVHVGQALLADVRHFGEGRLQSDDICIVSFGRSAT